VLNPTQGRAPKIGPASSFPHYPVTDHASRFLLLCEALEAAREDLACTAFERLFRERGLPSPHWGGRVVRIQQFRYRDPKRLA